MIFQNGTFTTSSEEEKLQLSFSPFNDNYCLYDLVCKSLPEKKGLKRKRDRMLFAMELVDNILKNNPAMDNAHIFKK